MNKILLSGIQPSGAMHIGNYLGAIKQWVDLQSDYCVFAMIANLHALTVSQEPEVLRSKTLEVAALLAACGIDSKKSNIFIQSHIPAHAELAWILNTITPLGELERMTQFKEKARISEKDIENILANDKILQENLEKLDTDELKVHLKKIVTGSVQVENEKRASAGLFMYPVLMAADILLYQTESVPVGEDQQQHLELARTLANKFNHRFGETFKIPQALILKNTARIMGLDDPTKKMSKSASSANNYIGLLDAPNEIRRKIKIAVTDSEKEIVYDEERKPAIANLLRIFSAFSGRNIADIENQYRDTTYAAFKNDLAELLVAKLEPIQTHYQELASDQEALLAILKIGAEQAYAIAKETISNAYQKVGFVR